MDPGEPFIDEHATVVHAPRALVWATVEDFTNRSLTEHPRTLLRRALGTHPPSGYAVASRTADTRLELTGRHRFARYWLVFDLADSGHGETRLSALTYASFPGARGRAYRALVVGSRMHHLTMRRVLTAIKAGAEDSDRT